MLGRTDGTGLDVAAAMLASRGSRLGRWSSSTTTVISMGSVQRETGGAWARDRDSFRQRWSQVVQFLYVMGEP